jgi:glycosyltransferase involved in cell wall biosynthesis
VVFAARLHERKRPEVFVDLAARVTAVLPDAEFVMIGPDEGRKAAVLARIADLGLADRVRYLGALPHAEVMDWLGRAAVHVLPSVDEPYAMTVLEAMSTGTPVVVTNSCGLADHVRQSGAGVVTSATVESLADAVIDLLRNPSRRAAQGRSGVTTAVTGFGIDVVARTLEAIYVDVLSNSSGNDGGGRG